MSVSEDVIRYLAASGVATLGRDIGTEDKPGVDDYLTIRVYGGEPPDRTKDGASIRYPRFQVSSRSKSGRVAAEKAEMAYRYLAGFSGLMNGAPYHVRALGEPFPLGRDEDGRERVVCSYEAN